MMKLAFTKMFTLGPVRWREQFYLLTREKEIALQIHPKARIKPNSASYFDEDKVDVEQTPNFTGVFFFSSLRE